MYVKTLSLHVPMEETVCSIFMRAVNDDNIGTTSSCQLRKHCQHAVSTVDSYNYYQYTIDNSVQIVYACVSSRFRGTFWLSESSSIDYASRRSRTRDTVKLTVCLSDLFQL